MTTLFDDAGTLILLKKVVHPATAAPQNALARAYSLLGYIEYELTLINPNASSARLRLCFAAKHINEALKLGLVSPAALTVAMAVENAMLRDDPDVAPLKYLWEMKREPNEELAQVRKQRAQRIRARPSAYVCAAEGCGITAAADQVRGLLSCSGKCAMEGKPSYCNGKQIQ